MLSLYPNNTLAYALADLPIISLSVTNINDTLSRTIVKTNGNIAE